MTRWERVEIDLLRLLAAGLAVALPVAVGQACGDLGAGMAAAIGALIVSSSGAGGSLRVRLVDLAASAAAGTAGTAIGLLCDRADPARTLVPVLAAVITGLVGGVRPSAAKAAAQFMVFLIVGGSLGGAATSVATTVGYVLLGCVFASLLTLVAYGFAHLILGPRDTATTAARSWQRDVSAWWGRVNSPVGWVYPLRLGSCLLAGEIVVHLLRGGHSYWILLTLVLVVQRDFSGGLVRTVERGVGTALGVVVAALLLNTVPVWVMISLLGVIGAARIHLRAANYTAYAVVMTPLIAVLSGLGHTLSTHLLRERVVDTLIGCLIAVIVGHLAWQRADPARSRPTG